MFELVSATLALLFPDWEYRMLWHKFGRFIRQEQRENQIPSDSRQLVVDIVLKSLAHFAQNVVIYKKRL